MKTGARIKKVRQLLNKSQQELADEVGITKQAISNIETGKSLPSFHLLCKLLVDYGINLNYLIGAKGSIFLQDEKPANSLKKTILKEVENLLKERGID